VRNSENDIAKHVQETAESIVCKALVACTLGESFDGFLVETLMSSNEGRIRRRTIRIFEISLVFDLQC